MSEQRKASDVLLELESKINTLLNLVSSQDLTIKLLTNKVNALTDSIKKTASAAPEAPKFKIEAVEENKKVQYTPEFKIEMDNSPTGFRRTSRPETYSNDQTSSPVFPMQLPKMDKVPEIVVPAPQEKKSASNDKNTDANVNAIPIMQRVVDKNGKSIFLAEVEIINMNNGETVYSTKTNGTGKWMASLPVGNYRVFLRKRESSTKEKLEVSQDIQVDGTQSKLELQTVIVR